MYHVNIVIDKIKDAELEAGYKTGVTAEMRFLRALYYYGMVQLWGDLPLITQPIPAGDAFAISRSPQAEVYNLIVDDLKEAAANLPAPDMLPAPGRASNGAAKTLLGKVYLAMGDKTSAAQVLMQVYNDYNGKQYDLLPHYGSLWGPGNSNKNTKEAIFEVQYKGGANNPFSSYWPAFAPFENFSITRFGGGINQVTDDLYNEFEAGDIRRDTSFELGYYKGGHQIPEEMERPGCTDREWGRSV
jgi:hypothetical protein